MTKTVKIGEQVVNRREVIGEKRQLMMSKVVTLKTEKARPLEYLRIKEERRPVRPQM